jgi:uncharacterized membrane protein
MVTTTSIGRAIQLGVASGIRSSIPLALVARAGTNDVIALRGERPFELLTRRHVANVLMLAIPGEIVIDKLPFTPKRTDLGPLVGRMILGATAAGAAAAGEGESIPVATGVGALAAAWGSFAATGARLALDQRGATDILVGLFEDALAIALALSALPQRAGKIV